MKTYVKTLTIGAISFCLGFGLNNFAISSNVPNTNYKIAVVDVSKVVSQSSQVQALKREQNSKMEELQKWLTTARADVDKQSSQEGKQKLVKKYDVEFAKKQDAIRKDYSTKLQTIDKSISNIIAKEAKSQNYNIVLAKGVVLYGGDDITSKVAKLVKK